MYKRIDKNENRLERHKRIRKKISGTPERPRLEVVKTNTHIYANIIDDIHGHTLVSASTVEKQYFIYLLSYGFSIIITISHITL